MSPKGRQTDEWQLAGNDNDGDVKMAESSGGKLGSSAALESDLRALSPALDTLPESPQSAQTPTSPPTSPPSHLQPLPSLQQALGIAAAASTFAPATEPTARGRNVLQRLRIGSNGSPSPPPTPAGAAERVLSPSGMAFNLGNRHASSNSPDPMAWESASFGDFARRSRASSAATDASRSLSRSASLAAGAGNALSPAQSFLSAFSPTGGSKSIGGRFASLGLSPAGDEEGYVVHGYRLGRELGSGGFAIVREAHKIEGGDANPHLPDVIAIKCVRHNPINQGQAAHAPPSGINFDGRRATSGVYPRPEKRDRRMSIAHNERGRAASAPWPHEPVPVVGALTGEGQSRVASPRWSPKTLSQSVELPARLEAGSRSPARFKSETDKEEVTTHPGRLRALLDREVELWSQLKHDHVVTLLDTAEHGDGFSYLFMPLCEGGNLLEFVNNGGKEPAQRERRKGRGSEIGGWSALGLSQTTTERTGLPLDSVKDIFGQIAQAMSYMHQEVGITHRDVKLENILLEKSVGGPAGGRWKLADFGLADASGELPRAVRPSLLPGSGASTPGPGSRTRGAGTPLPPPPLGSLSRANSVSRHQPASVTSLHAALHPAGSLPYAPPEQMKSPVPILHPGVDVWASGCVLYALLTGHLPIEDDFEPRLRNKIIKGAWKVPVRIQAEAAKTDDERVELEKVLELLRGLLEPNPEKRWDIQRILSCRWLQGTEAAEAADEAIGGLDGDVVMVTVPSEPVAGSRGRSPHPTRGATGGSNPPSSRSRSRTSQPPLSPSAERGRSSLLGPDPHRVLTRSQSRARAAAAAAAGALGMTTESVSSSSERGRGRGRSGSTSTRRTSVGGTPREASQESGGGQGRSASRGGECEAGGVGPERRRSRSRFGGLGSGAGGAGTPY